MSARPPQLDLDTIHRTKYAQPWRLRRVPQTHKVTRGSGEAGTEKMSMGAK